MAAMVSGTLHVLVGSTHEYSLGGSLTFVGSSSPKLLHGLKSIFNWKRSRTFYRVIDNNSLRSHKFLLCTGRYSSPAWGKRKTSQPEI